MKIAIVGGTGDFGRWYSKFFLSKGFDVTIVGRSDSGKNIADDLGTSFQKFPSTIDADVVMLSVPNDVAPSLFNAVAPLCNEDALIFDVCSVKQNICKAMRSSNAKQELLSIHPMHGPRVSSLAGIPVVFIPTKDNGEKSKKIKEIFIEAGANVFESNEDEHDSVLSIVQGLTHFSSVVSAGVISELGVDFSRTLNFKSPNYELFSTLIARILLQNPALYSEIQFENPKNEVVRGKFLEIARRLASESKNDYQKSMETFGKGIKKGKKILSMSDRAISSFNSEKMLLANSIGKKVALRGFDGKIHYGKVIKTENEDVLIEENGKETKISLNNFSLLNPQSLIEWKQTNLKTKTRDFSFLLPSEINKSMVLFIFSKFDGVLKTELIDEYTNEKIPSGKKSLTIRIHSFDEDIKETEQRILSALAEFGFVLR